MNTIHVKSFNLDLIIDEQQRKKIVRIWREDQENFHNRCLKEIVEPSMGHINEVTKQENDARYITYAIEAALLKLNIK